MKYLTINGRRVGPGEPVLIVAELSANHLQDFDLAVRTVRAMKDAGADAVKFQTYSPETITLDCDNEHFQISHGTLWDGTTLHKLYQTAYMPWEWHEPLKKLVHELGLFWFSTPVDPTSADYLVPLDPAAYKLASFEITDIPLIEHIAKKGKPFILSTGVAELADIEEAVQACRRAGNDAIGLLHCVSAYPAPLEEVNLKTIPHLAEAFDVVVGLSDHTFGTTVAAAAVAMGATIVEKHFILDRSLGGPDAAFSLEPQEFSELVRVIRETEKALGRVTYDLSEKERKNRKFTKSLFVAQDIRRGEMLTPANIRSVRPGTGLHPRHLPEVLGCRARVDLVKGTPLNWMMVDKEGE